MNVGRRSSGRIALSHGSRAQLTEVIAGAMALEDKEDWKGACEVLERGLTVFPDEVELHVRLAEALRFTERHDEAIAILERAKTIAPDDIAVLLELASALRMRGDRARALAAAKEVAEKHPTDLDARSALVLARASFGLPDLALEDARALAEKYPDRLELTVDYGSVLVRLGRYTEAIAKLDAVVAAKPNFYEAWILLAEANKKLYRTARWTVAARKAHEIAPRIGRSALWMYRVVAHAEGRTEEAREYLDRAVALNPQLAEAFIELGVLAWKERDEESAAEFFERAARLAPWDGKAVGSLAQFRASSGKAMGQPASLAAGSAGVAASDKKGGGSRAAPPSVDFGALERAAREAPSARLPYYLGRLYLATLKDPDRAAPFLELAIAHGPEDVDAIHLLGETYKMREQYDLAIAQYRRATELAPALGPAWDGLAFSLWNTGSLEDAAKAYQQAVKHMPKDASVRHAYGEALMEMNKMNEAVLHLLRGAALDPTNANIQASLAFAFEGAGAKDEALKAARRAQEGLPGDEELRALVERLGAE